MSTYLITGATSFIGMEICRTLQNNGHTVIAVCRDSSKAKDRLPSGIEVMAADMREYARLHEKVKHADIFINLAWAGTGHDCRNTVDIQENNIEYTVDAMHSAHKMGCKVFVEAGSQAEYGTVMTTITEETPCRPFSEYGRAKLAINEKGVEFSESTGMKYVHLRIFSIFGEEDHEWTLVMSCINKMLTGQEIELSSCTQHWNFLYYKDAATQIMKLCEYAMRKDGFLHGIYNIASRDTRILKDFVERMKELTNTSSKICYGKIVPVNIVSLQPDVSKTENATRHYVYTPFDKVVESIIEKEKKKLEKAGKLQYRHAEECGGTSLPLSGNPLHCINSKFLRFILIGILNTVFGVGVYCLMIFIGLPYFIATLISNVLGVLFNFKTTGKFVFENNDNSLIFRFTLCYLFIYVINTGVVKLMLLSGLDEYWAGISATPIVAICSFFMLKRFVYRKK